MSCIEIPCLCLSQERHGGDVQGVPNQHAETKQFTTHRVRCSMFILSSSICNSLRKCQHAWHWVRLWGRDRDNHQVDVFTHPEVSFQLLHLFVVAVRLGVIWRPRVTFQAEYPTRLTVLCSSQDHKRHFRMMTHARHPSQQTKTHKR